MLLTDTLYRLATDSLFAGDADPVPAPRRVARCAPVTMALPPLQPDARPMPMLPDAQR